MDFLSCLFQCMVACDLELSCAMEGPPHLSGSEMEPCCGARREDERMDKTWAGKDGLILRARGGPLSPCTPTTPYPRV